MIRFNQDGWLEPYIKMNTELWQKAKNDFEKDFFKLMNNTISGKTMENLRKHRDIKLVKTKRRRYYSLSEPNYLTKIFSQNYIDNRTENNSNNYE